MVVLPTLACVTAAEQLTSARDATAQTLRAIRLVLSNALPVDAGDDEVRVLRVLCHLPAGENPDGTWYYQDRSKLSDRLLDCLGAYTDPRDSQQEPRTLQNKLERHLVPKLAALLRDYEERGEYDFVRSEPVTTRVPPRVVRDWLISRYPPGATIRSEGLVAADLEVDVALGRSLRDRYERLAPELADNNGPKTILELLGVGVDTAPARLVLIDGDSGSGKSSLLLALAHRLAKLALSPAAGQNPALIPLRIELPLPSGESGGLTTAIHQELGDEVAEALKRDGGPGGPRLALLIDGADQDGRFAATAQEVEKITDLSWVGAVVVTGRPGFTRWLSSTVRQAHHTSTHEVEAYGATVVDLEPLDLEGAVRLLTTFARHRIADTDLIKPFVHTTLSSLSIFDRDLAHYADENDGDFDVTIQTMREVRRIVGAQPHAPKTSPPSLDPSLTPLLILLAAWVVDPQTPKTEINDETDLLSEVMATWAKREAQRLATKTSGHGPSAEVVISQLEQLVYALGFRFVEVDANDIRTSEVVSTLADFMPTIGLPTQEMDTWIERLSDCGLLVRDRHRQVWRFTHRLLADVACARHLASCQTEDFASGGVLAWDQLVQAQINSEGAPFPFHFRPASAPPMPVPTLLGAHAQRWADVLRLHILHEDRTGSRTATDAVGELAQRRSARSVDDDDVAAAFTCALFRLAVQVGAGRVDPLLRAATELLQPLVTADADLAETRIRLTEATTDLAEATHELDAAGQCDDEEPPNESLQGQDPEDMSTSDYLLSLPRTEQLGWQVAFASYLLKHEEAAVADLEREVRNGPTAAQALARSRPQASHYPETDLTTWAARYVYTTRGSEDPYIVAASVARLERLDENPAELTTVLLSEGPWADIAAQRIEDGDRDIELPALAFQIRDDDAHDELIRRCPIAVRWMLGCMLPPIGAAPAAGQPFWRSIRPGIALMRDQVHSSLRLLGLDMDALNDASMDLPTDDSFMDYRPGASDATRTAARLIADRVESPNVEQAIAQLVADPMLPWATRVWCARVLLAAAPPSANELIAALAVDAVEDCRPGRVPDTASWPRRARAAATAGRYFLTSQTPREDFLGEMGIEGSAEASLTAAGQRLIAAAKTRRSRDLGKALREVTKQMHDLFRVETGSATDAGERAIVIASQIAPDLVEKHMDDWIRHWLGTEFEDPGPAWNLASTISWGAQNARSPWWIWLSEVPSG